jgi:hypothetical protein
MTLCGMSLKVMTNPFRQVLERPIRVRIKNLLLNVSPKYLQVN